MAKNTGLKVGDSVTVRWRDALGTFDARDVKIVHIMKTVVPTVDQAQIWVPLDKLQGLTRMQDEDSLELAVSYRVALSVFHLVYDVRRAVFGTTAGDHEDKP